MPPTSSGSSGYKVTSQTPGFGIGPDGKAVEGVTINFRTSLGNLGTVFVPRTAYSAQAAIDAIRAHASELDQVSQSGG